MNNDLTNALNDHAYVLQAKKAPDQLPEGKTFGVVTVGTGGYRVETRATHPTDTEQGGDEPMTDTTDTPTTDPHNGLTCEQVEAWALDRYEEVRELRAAHARAIGARPDGPEQLREAVAAVARVEAVIAGQQDEADALAPTTIAAASVHSGTYVRMLAAVETEHLHGMLAETRADLVAALDAEEGQQ